MGKMLKPKKPSIKKPRMPPKPKYPSEYINPINMKLDEYSMRYTRHPSKDTAAMLERVAKEGLILENGNVKIQFVSQKHGARPIVKFFAKDIGFKYKVAEYNGKLITYNEKLIPLKPKFDEYNLKLAEYEYDLALYEKSQKEAVLIKAKAELIAG